MFRRLGKVSPLKPSPSLLLGSAISRLAQAYLDLELAVIPIVFREAFALSRALFLLPELRLFLSLPEEMFATRSCLSFSSSSSLISISLTNLLSYASLSYFTRSVISTADAAAFLRLPFDLLLRLYLSVVYKRSPALASALSAIEAASSVSLMSISLTASLIAAAFYYCTRSVTSNATLLPLDFLLLLAVATVPYVVKERSPPLASALSALESASAWSLS